MITVGFAPALALQGGKWIMEVVGYVMLSALVLYMVQQIADLAA